MGYRRIFVGLVLMATGCSTGSLSLTEYGAQAETLAAVVTERIDSLDAEVKSYARTTEGTQEYWERRLEARVSFLQGLEDLEPPDDAEELHEVVLDIFSRLNAAEEALAARVATFETPTDPGEWWATTEGDAARRADQEVAAICHVAQAEFDKTQSEQTDVFEDMPWIPTATKEVVRVAFGCPGQS